ncbi:hypothetical protein LSAT2_000070 [Lamellibrachia satsuma]|nr:hypothetical protein LSAT2_000070 [Lamellibrachia satsuma]
MSGWVSEGIYQTVPIYGASSTVRRRFHEGVHYIEYKAVDETGNFDSCSFSVSVTVIRCRALYNPLFGVLTCDASNVYGSTCSVSCIPGYSVVGDARIKCGRGRQWSGDIPFCRTTTCPDPGTPIGGARFCTTPTHAYGSVCNFDCSRGTKLIGHDRLICKSSGGRTFWSGPTPVCEEVVPPVVELCPNNIQITTGEPLTEVQRPSVVFRTTKGEVAPFVCSSFGKQPKYSFPLGTHHVTCTAFDPDFGDSASATCTFMIKVKANPCRALVQPLNGLLLCSRAHGGGSSMHDTTCKLFCHKGLALPRSDGHVTDQYECDNTGTWQPASRVPSCVRPKRPLELRMPAEILFRTDDCSSESMLRRLQSEFQAKLQVIIRMQSACAFSPGDCIVEDVVATCNLRPSRSRRSRTRRYPGSRLSRERRYVPSRRQRFQRQQAQLARRRRMGRHSRRGQYVVPVQLHLATRVPETGGGWPDEYHSASHRLFEMFDHFEKQVMAGTFRLKRNLSVSVEHDSLTFHHEVAVCDIGYQFNKNILLCVPCGAGTFYDLERGVCALCGVGDYQNEEATFACKRCPDGTASVERGATNVTQCVEIDECESSPCLNYGQCRDSHASYTCQCHPGYAGAHCEVKVYDCYVHSCQNNGLCRPEGELNYTCECTAGYTGDYCQYDSVDGQWSSWSEWTACTKSCKGGVTTRNRTCDSPSPSNGGRTCEEAPVEEKVCNLHPCPECRRLRRPYRGSMECVTADELITCTVNCPAGYDFAGQTFKTYVCGRNTSYLWPHESPDNPRCVLPACTRITEAQLRRYEFRSALPVECRAADDEERLKREISKRATELTSQLSCIRDGTCQLKPPTVSGCHHRARREAPADKYGGLSYVEFEVSITRDSDSSRTKDLSQKETSQELTRLGDDLSNRSARSDLYVVVDGRKVVLDPDNTTTSNTLVCPEGSEASLYGDYCVECSPGSFYNISVRACIRCDVGSYQPAPAQTECITCPDAKTTYGRGAVFEIECYDSDGPPPAIPLDYVGDSSSDAAAGLSIYIIVIVVIVCVLVVVIVAVLLVRLRRRYYANYNVVKKSSEAAAEMAATETSAAVTPTPEPETEEMKLCRTEYTAPASPTDAATRTAVV